MFSLSVTVQPQVTVPLSHLINVIHSLKSLVVTSSTATCKSRKPKEHVTDSEPLYTEQRWNLRDLGLSDFGTQQLDELVNRVFPHLSPRETSLSLGINSKTAWRTSHVSTHSFVSNKHGFSCGHIPMPATVFYKQPPSPLQSVCTELQHWPMWIQSRGFKTLSSKTRRRQSGFDRPVESEGFTPSFMKGFLTRDKGIDMESLDSLLKNNNIPDGQQDAFKRGCAEGFLKAQAVTPHTQDSMRTQIILRVLFIICIYGILNSPYMSVQTTSGLDSAVQPMQMKGVTFEHVKGVEEAKNELQEVVEFLKNPQKFTALGGKLPKGLLLVGPPGTGKTLLGRAVAGEAGVPFYYVSASEFDEVFVGVGASRIRSLFREAKANAPCLIFIDELDSVGGKRFDSPFHPYSGQTLNQLLAEMDGFKPNEGVIVIGATNFPNILDSALVRPGRFDVTVVVPKPDVKGRTEILNWYFKKIKVDPAIETSIIARGTVEFSGADLENLVNQAALKAAVDGKDMVTMKELEFAKDKILMGIERRSLEVDKQDKLLTAYYESGRAIVAHYTKDAIPINKVTIMARGIRLGNMSMLPESDNWFISRSQLLAQIDVNLGGRVAEEIIFGPEYISTGACLEFENATAVATLMVTRFSMCKKLGVMTYRNREAQSPEIQAAVEHEVRLLLKESYERAKAILKSHTKEHKDLAEALLMYETLDAKEIQLVLEGKTLETR